MALSDIQHIVVLVLENRSFDHMLGYLSLEGGRTDVDGLRADMSNLARTPRGPENITPTRLPAPRFHPGPEHQYPNVVRQMGPYDGERATMKGFVDDYSTVQGAGDGRAIMGYYDAETLYFYDFLAREYLICDRWFSAFPGPTEVNRAFLLAGHSANKIVNTELVLYTSTHRLMTVFDRLSHAQVSWRSYFHDAPDLRTFTQFAFQLGNILKIDEFYEDAARGTLPSVSWIDPNFELTGLIGLPDAANDDHPPADIRRGQKLVSDIYDALSANPEKWKQTLFIVTYDEHGGFFDHVEPPIRKDRAPFRKNTLFDRFGVRVPAFLISPWVARGSVSHVELEHTSIAKTILDRFCPGDDHAVMGERLAGAPALDSLLSSSCRDDIPKIAAPATVTTVALAVGGASFEPAPLGAVPRSDLQLRLHALRMRLLGEGMPPDTV